MHPICIAWAAAAALAWAAGEPQPAPAPPPAPAPAPPRQAETGFEPLFNGRDLTGWVGDTAGYVVEDGAIVCGPQGRNLFTAREFGDFTLRLEFKLTPGANNGIGVRAPLEGDAAYQGMEIQVLDSDHEKYRGWLKPHQRHGSVYGVVAAKPEGMRPAGEWNEQEIALKGTHVRVTLNGVVIVDADVAEAARDGTPDGQPHPGLARTSGHIGFLGHGDRVAFRNIRIRLP
jgi:hypothetical protein